MQYVLVLNAGSSSLKFASYRVDASGLGPLDVRGRIDGIGRSPRLSVADGGGNRLAERWLDNRLDNQSAFMALVVWLRSHYGRVPVAGVGHRVVHGGAEQAQRRSSRRPSSTICARLSRDR